MVDAIDQNWGSLDCVCTLIVHLLTQLYKIPIAEPRGGGGGGGGGVGGEGPEVILTGEL